MPLIAFPVIPSLQDSPVMAVSAATIDKGHNSGLRYLLGESHASMPMGPWATRTHDSESPTDVCRVWVYHTSFTIRWSAKVRVTSPPEDYWLHVRAKDKDGVWQILKQYQDITNDGTDDWYSEDVDLSSGGLDLEAEFPIGKIYEWRIQTSATDSGYDVIASAWGAFCRKAVVGWQAPHDFAEDEQSAAAHFNDIRTDLNALNAQLSPIVPFSICRNQESWDTDDRKGYIIGIYRYRPESLYGAIKLKFHSNSNDEFRFYIELHDSDGNEAEVYTTERIEVTGTAQLEDATVDLTAGDAATAISNAGITLTLGNYYLVEVGIERWDGGDAEEYDMILGVIARWSSGTPHGDWEALEEWAEGDTDFGPTHLDKMRTNLLLFYTGGNEVMFGESPSVMSWYYLINTRRFSTIHRKRRLVYHVKDATDGTTLKLWYGDDYDESLELPLTDQSEHEWLDFDLSELPIPWGSYYHLVGNIDGAFECDEAYN